MKKGKEKKGKKRERKKGMGKNRREERGRDRRKLIKKLNVPGIQKSSYSLEYKNIQKARVCTN